MTYFKPNFDQLKATTAIDGDGHIAHQPKIVFLSATIPAVHFSMMATNLSCHVCGILWLIKYQPVAGRMLLTLTILDRSGIIHVISWNHNRAQFQGLVGKPVVFYRVRVGRLNGQKIAELVPGSGNRLWEAGASVWHVSDFAGSKDLVKFWLSTDATQYRWHPAHRALLRTAASASKSLNRMSKMKTHH